MPLLVAVRGATRIAAPRNNAALWSDCRVSTNHGPCRRPSAVTSRLEEKFREPSDPQSRRLHRHRAPAPLSNRAGLAGRSDAIGAGANRRARPDAQRVLRRRRRSGAGKRAGIGGALAEARAAGPPRRRAGVDQGPDPDARLADAARLAHRSIRSSRGTSTRPPRHACAKRVRCCSARRTRPNSASRARPTTC